MYGGGGFATSGSTSGSTHTRHSLSLLDQRVRSIYLLSLSVTRTGPYLAPKLYASGTGSSPAKKCGRSWLGRCCASPRRSPRSRRRASLGARRFSRPSTAPPHAAACCASRQNDDDRLSNFWGRISDPLNSPSPRTGLSLIQSFENAFAVGQKVHACYDVLEQVGKGLELGLKGFGLCLAFIVISVASTVPTWMKSILRAEEGSCLLCTIQTPLEIR
jgi:hypothetical protein